MQPVWCGNADRIDVRVRQQFLVLPVGLRPGGLGGLIQPVSVGITDGYDLSLRPRLNEPLHRRKVAGPAPANADEANADGVVGAMDAPASDEWRRTQQTQGSLGGGGGLEEVPAVHGLSWFALGAHQIARVPPEFVPAPAQNP